MPLPIAPIAGLALRYGTVALASYALVRYSGVARRDHHSEEAMDELDDGVFLRRDTEQMNTNARLRRTIRLGRSGPGIEIDAAALTRIRLRRV